MNAETSAARIQSAISLSAEALSGDWHVFGFKDLPDCHVAREEVADLLADSGLKVQVDRFGTGNAKHSGVLAGCGVSRLRVMR